jgi:hypothetical protein
MGILGSSSFRSSALIMALAFVSAILAGCSAIQTYPGAARHDDQIAIVYSQNGVTFLEVDDIWKGKEPLAIALLPGKHRLKVRCVGSLDGRREFYGPATTEVNVEAGGKYLIKSHFIQDSSTVIFLPSGILGAHWDVLLEKVTPEQIGPKL